jgi:Tfp pilus assembly protein PilX
MLANRSSCRAAPTVRNKQKGVVLFITLIVLVAMTLAAISLVRSVDTTNVIAGNLAFHQAATYSGDAGVESAIAWLQSPPAGVDLTQINPAYSFYSPTRNDPAAGQSWDNYWTTTLAASANTLAAADAAGNTASYVIDRMCNAVGPATSPASGCSVSQTTVAAATTSSSQGAGQVGLQYTSQVYYRVTVRIAGPRNTVSYIQSIVAL